MSTDAGAGQQQGPSEEELREYARQLRPVPADQIVTELLFTALNAAQAKLGRKDARLLIDLAALMVEQVRPHASDDLTKQVDQVLGQLRLSQVEAEREAAAKGEAEPNDLDHVPAPGAASSSSPPPTSPQPQQEPSPARSKLWLPGQS